MSAEEINRIKTLPTDSIYTNLEFKGGTDYFHAWKLHEGSSLTKYFHKKGLQGSWEIYETLLTSYRRYLNEDEVEII